MISGGGAENSGSMPQEPADEIPIRFRWPSRNFLGLWAEPHHRIVQSQDLRFIEIDCASVLTNVTGTVYTTRQLLELFSLDSQQGTHPDLCGLGYRFERKRFFLPPAG